MNYTITKTTDSGIYHYDCTNMAVEYYSTYFDSATITGTGKIDVHDVGEMEVGDVLLLGPSTDVDDMHAFESVEITSISGGWIYITTSGIVPPIHEYDSEDAISYYKYIYLFNNVSHLNDDSKGCLYKIDAYDGIVIENDDNGAYANVEASAWNSTYEAVGFVKGTNLLYIDPDDSYNVIKSQALDNINADDEITLLPIYDLIFDSSDIYRLQKDTTLRDDDGTKGTFSWTYYNYHQDTIIPYTNNISLSVSPDGIIINEDDVTITAIVRDQFGVGLLSKLVYFYRSGGDPAGSFDPLDGQVYTNASGIASIIYNGGDYDLTGTNAEVTIEAKTDGSSTYTGSQYRWGDLSLFLYTNFTSEIGHIIQKPTLYTQMIMTQVSGMEGDFFFKQLSKFQFPGGDWGGSRQPSNIATTIKQIPDQQSDVLLNAIENEADFSIVQNKVINDLQLSQTYISRHLLYGHTDDVNVDQFRFIEDASPAFWSEKNPVNVNIWIRLRPFGFDLDKNSVIFRVKEYSYAGDTGYVDVTSSCIITTFDAGGGLLGVDIFYNPPTDFHHNAVVYVSIEIYDNAPTPNIILTDYWFKVIGDYKAPYITNESPAREEEDVSVNTNISFDVLDTGAGVNIDSLKFYVNNRYKIPVVSSISGGYHVSYNPPEDFYYSETVEISVKVEDSSIYNNVLYDMWRFYCVGSSGPWFDRGSFYPRNCVRGVYRKITGISFNVYGIGGDGIDRESILVTIGGKERSVDITPIIYRIE